MTPPSDLTPSTALAFLALALGTWLTGRTLQRGTQRAEQGRPAEHVDVPTTTGDTQRVALDGVPAQLASALITLTATVSQQQERLAEQARLIGALQLEVAAEKAHSHEQDDQLAQLQAERDRAITALTAVHDWIDAGAPPPPPRREPWLPNA